MSGRYLLRTQLRRSRGETVYREWVNRSMPGWLCTTRFWLPCRMYNRANHFEYANVSLTAHLPAIVASKGRTNARLQARYLAILTELDMHSPAAPVFAGKLFGDIE